MVIRCHDVADMYGRNNRALCRFIIENNEVGTCVEDHAGVPVWSSPAGMWNSMGQRVFGWSHLANDQDDDWPGPRYVIAEEETTSSAVISFRGETDCAIVASGVGCRSVFVRGVHY